MSGTTSDGTWTMTPFNGRIPWHSEEIQANAIITLRDKDDQTIAFAYGFFDEEKKIFDVGYAHVNDDRRGNGVYTRLLDSMRRHMSVRSDEDQNNSAKNAYKKLGAKYDHLKRGYHLGRIDETSESTPPTQVVKSVRAFTHAQLEKVYRFMRAKGYDIHGVHDAELGLRRQLSLNIEPTEEQIQQHGTRWDARKAIAQEINSGTLEGDWALAAKHALGLGEKKSHKPIADSAKLIAKAIRKFGTTGDFRQAGFIMPNGTLLNLSGNNRELSRGIDHREVSDFIFNSDNRTESLRKFMDLGPIRINGDFGSIHCRTIPTRAQYTKIRELVRLLKPSSNREVFIDVESNVSIESRQYPAGITPDRVVADIEAFYKSGKLPGMSLTSQFHENSANADTACPIKVGDWVRWKNSSGIVKIVHKDKLLVNFKQGRFWQRRKINPAEATRIESPMKGRSVAKSFLKALADGPIQKAPIDESYGVGVETIDDLKHYLSTDRDLDASDYEFLLPRWIAIRKGFGGEEDYQGKITYKRLTPGLKAEFDDWLFTDEAIALRDKNALESPATISLEYIRDVRREDWLIHYSDAADKIVADKSFKFGSGTDGLHLTTWKDDRTHTGPFAFAFEADSEGINYQIMSDEAVLFRADKAILTYHQGDEQYQVIFDRHTAKDFILLKRDTTKKLKYNPPVSYGGIWSAIWNGRSVFTGDMEDLINWIDKNFEKLKSGKISRLAQMPSEIGHKQQSSVTSLSSEGVSLREKLALTGKAVKGGDRYKFEAGFKAWFAGSKAVDSKRRPLVLFHGTKKPVAKFTSSRMGVSSNVFGSWENERHGIFLAEDPKLAAEYAEQGDNWSGASTVPVYLQAKNPIDLTGHGLSSDMFDAIEKLVDGELTDKQREDGHSGYNYARFINGLAGDSRAWALFDKDDGVDPDDVVRIFKKLGFDSAIIDESSETGAKTRTWIAFDPNQVKSAIANSGTFRTDSDDITEANDLGSDFEQWFRDSKAVDKNGNPILVYHGTDADFDEFKDVPHKKHTVRLLGPGFYFTTDKKFASTKGSRVISAYLRIENPRDMRGGGLLPDNSDDYDGTIAVGVPGVSPKHLTLVVRSPEQIRIVDYGKTKSNIAEDAIGNNSVVIEEMARTASHKMTAIINIPSYQKRYKYSQLAKPDWENSEYLINYLQGELMAHPEDFAITGIPDGLDSKQMENVSVSGWKVIRDDLVISFSAEFDDGKPYEELPIKIMKAGTKLWHGTNEVSARHIMKNGFQLPRRNTRVANGHVLGKAIYFTTEEYEAKYYWSDGTVIEVELTRDVKLLDIGKHGSKGQLIKTASGGNRRNLKKMEAEARRNGIDGIWSMSGDYVRGGYQIALYPPAPVKITGTSLGGDLKQELSVTESHKTILKRDELEKLGCFEFPWAVRMQVPVDQIEGLDPEPASWVDDNNNERKFKAGDKIDRPVAIEIVDGNFILADGNHRVKQAKLNNDKTIDALVYSAAGVKQLTPLTEMARTKKVAIKATRKIADDAEREVFSNPEKKARAEKRAVKWMRSFHPDDEYKDITIEPLGDLPAIRPGRQVSLTDVEEVDITGWEIKDDEIIISAMANFEDWNNYDEFPSKKFAKGTTLYHATKRYNISGIVKNGFRHSYELGGKTHGSVLGPQAVYFTPEEAEAWGYWGRGDSVVFKVELTKDVELIDVGKHSGDGVAYDSLRTRLRSHQTVADGLADRVREMGCDGIWSHGVSRMAGGNQIALNTPAPVKIIEMLRKPEGDLHEGPFVKASAIVPMRSNQIKIISNSKPVMGGLATEARGVASAVWVGDNLQVTNYSGISTGQLGDIARSMRTLGYDVNGGKDALVLMKNMTWRAVADPVRLQAGYVEEMNNAKAIVNDGVFKGDWAKSIALALGASRPIVKRTFKQENNAKALIKLALKNFGTTDVWENTGYILPDGEQLDMSEGLQADKKSSINHRRIDVIYGGKGIDTGQSRDHFIETGAIRVDDGEDLLEIGPEPTQVQYTKLRVYIERHFKLHMDLKGPHGAAGREYETVSTDQVIGDIKAFYRNGKLPERSGVSQFHESASVSGWEIAGKSDSFEYQEPDDEFFYHVTTPDNVSAILKDGLVPGTGRRSMANGFYASYSRGKAFVTERSAVKYWADIIESHLEHDGYNEDSEDPIEITALRIRKKNVDEGELQKDEIGTADAPGKSYYSTGPIRTSSINEGGDATWDNESANDWLDHHSEFFDHLADQGVVVRIIGSVATDGQSDNDLDVLVTPSKKMGIMACCQALLNYFGNRSVIGPGGMQTVGVTQRDGRQIDFFIGEYRKLPKEVKKPKSTLRTHTFYHGTHAEEADGIEKNGLGADMSLVRGLEHAAQRAQHYAREEGNKQPVVLRFELTFEEVELENDKNDQWGTLKGNLMPVERLSVPKASVKKEGVKLDIPSQMITETTISIKPWSAKVYHGGKPIEKSASGETIWFSTCIDVAAVNGLSSPKWYLHLKPGIGKRHGIEAAAAEANVQEAVVTLRKPFFVDAKDESYFDIKRPKEMDGWATTDLVDTDLIADWAKENGYDGVVIRNVLEGKGVCDVADTIVVFSKSSITKIRSFKRVEEASESSEYMPAWWVRVVGEPTVVRLKDAEEHDQRLMEDPETYGINDSPHLKAARKLTSEMEAEKKGSPGWRSLRSQRTDELYNLWQEVVDAGIWVRVRIRKTELNVTGKTKRGVRRAIQILDSSNAIQTAALTVLCFQAEDHTGINCIEGAVAISRFVDSGRISSSTGSSQFRESTGNCDSDKPGLSEPVLFHYLMEEVRSLGIERQIIREDFRL